ncbi:MAG: hypothetical protein D6693_08530 [Planctomycetota bacterium]|nr:MAG: hypothetical protein D6693_08530 [Planctomycetota bacterium]
MPCLIALLALVAPRLTIVVLVIVSDWIGAAYQTVLWPLLGFVFMPYTTLAYALAIHQAGSVSGGWLALVVLAVLADLGSMGGGGRSAHAVVVVREP